MWFKVHQSSYNVFIVSLIGVISSTVVSWMYLSPESYCLLWLASSLGQCAESIDSVWATTNYRHICRRHLWGCCWDIWYELWDYFIWSSICIPVDLGDHWSERLNYFLFVLMLFQVQKTDALVSSHSRRREALLNIMLSFATRILQHPIILLRVY